MVKTASLSLLLFLFVMAYVVLVSFAACDSRPVNLADGAAAQPDAAPGAPDVVVSDASTLPPDASGFCATNAECAADAYCHIEGACQVTGGKMGECRVRPEECDTAYNPVCGCDGATHSNVCAAHAKGVNVAHSGSCSGVVVITDKNSYTAKENVVGTVINNTADSVFLQGCSIFNWEKQLGTTWVDKGPTILCGWEGVAKEVKPGASFSEDNYPHGPGTWRLAALYGVGCTPDLPLSGANCSSTATARSNPFTVGTTLEICISLQSDYATAMIAAKKCSSGVNTPQCTIKVLESLACNCSTYVEDDSMLAAIHKQYLALGCDKLSGLPVCPPVACPDIQGSGCVQNKCVDFGPD